MTDTSFRKSIIKAALITSAFIIMATMIIVLGLACSDTYAASGGNGIRSAKPAATALKYEDANRITWNEVKGAKYYRVYRATSKKGRYKKIRKVSRTAVNAEGKLTCDDRSSESGKVYYYKVRAYKSARQYSKYSAPVRIKTVYRIYVACGHGTNNAGRWDPGCTWKGMQEAELMLPITQDLVRYLRRSGIYVYTDADDGNRMNIIRNIEFANNKKLSLYMSVHCDYKNAKPGTMPLYYGRKSKTLAKNLNNSVHSMINIEDRGLVKRPELLELNKTKVPACIFETGTISKDYRIFINQHDLYGKALAMGVCRYLGAAFRP